MLSKWNRILWKSRSLEFYQINEMFSESARDSSTRIQRQIYPVSRATTRHSVSAKHISLFPFSFFLKRTSHESGFHHWRSSMKLCWCALKIKGSKPSITAILGSSFPLSRNSSEVSVGIPPITEIIPISFSWIRSGCFAVLPLERPFSSSYLPGALKPVQSRAFSELSRSWG